ncbi:MAG: hypothetical protein IJ594_09365 [Oscillospiraceae bacterium]|nr:hypothetical protein [Oscillospiraceae bacterium]
MREKEVKKASEIRLHYIVRLVARVVIAAIVTALYFLDRAQFDVLYGFNFFRRFSLLHVLWVIWVLDMLWQLVPAKNKLALGSQKLFQFRFRPIKEVINYQALHRYIVTTTKAAYKVFLIWAAAVIALVALHRFRVLPDVGLFFVSLAFYICDLICVLIWCPFRLIMKNRCCTTCRIFNWDHLMMFSPMIAVHGFYSLSLLLMAIAVWLVWELCVMMYPERFWEQSNAALTCANCTDKLCTQYCQKLRPNA